MESLRLFLLYRYKGWWRAQFESKVDKVRKSLRYRNKSNWKWTEYWNFLVRVYSSRRRNYQEWPLDNLRSPIGADLAGKKNFVLHRELFMPEVEWEILVRDLWEGLLWRRIRVETHSKQASRHYKWQSLQTFLQGSYQRCILQGWEKIGESSDWSLPQLKLNWPAEQQTIRAKKKSKRRAWWKTTPQVVCRLWRSDGYRTKRGSKESTACF